MCKWSKSVFTIYSSVCKRISQQIWDGQTGSLWSELYRIFSYDINFQTSFIFQTLSVFYLYRCKINKRLSALLPDSSTHKETWKQNKTKVYYNYKVVARGLWWKSQNKKRAEEICKHDTWDANGNNGRWFQDNNLQYTVNTKRKKLFTQVFVFGSS